MREWEKPAHPSKLKKKCNYETPYWIRIRLDKDPTPDLEPQHCVDTPLCQASILRCLALEQPAEHGATPHVPQVAER